MMIERKVRPDFRNGAERSGWISYQGRKMLFVTIPKIHRGDLHPKTANSIRKQLQLSSAEFEALYDCPLTFDDFQRHLARLATG